MLQNIFQKLGSNANLIFSQKSVVNEASELSSDPKTEGLIFWQPKYVYVAGIIEHQEI